MLILKIKDILSVINFEFLSYVSIILKNDSLNYKLMNKSNSQKYIFKLSNDFLSIEESNVFKDFLKEVQLDNNIWNVFESMFRSGIKGTEPLLLRIYENSDFKIVDEKKESRVVLLSR